MNTRSALAAALATIALQAALAARWVGVLPGEARADLAALVLVLAPGAAWLALLGVRPPGGRLLAPGWALGLGVGWNGVLLALTALLRVPFTVWATLSMATTTLLWSAVLLRSRAGRRDGAGAAADGGEAATVLGALAACGVLLAVAAAAWVGARFGPTLAIISDSPDHVGTLRRMLEQRTLFPNDAFFLGAGRDGIDPRKFLWHGEAALIAHLAGVDPLVAWRALPALLAPLLVLNAAALGALVGGGAGAAFTAWATLLTYGGSLAATPISASAFAARLADHLALAASVAVLADVTRPSRAARAAAVGLALGAAATHVFAAAQFALVFAALGLGLWARERRVTGELRRLLGTALAVGLAITPFALWQVLRTPPPANPIHTDAQGLMTLWDHARIVSPGVLWDWMGPAWLLVPLLAPLAWREGRGRPAVLFLATTPLAVALTCFTPPVVALLQPKLGYLLMRVVWMTPLYGLIGFAGAHALRVWPESGRRARVALAARGLVTLLLLAPALADAARVVAHAREIAAAERARSAAPWGDALRWMAHALPPGQVVLSDPATSYSIPMMTPHYVVTLLDQHSSPSDAHALERLLDARDALDPFGGWGRLREVVRRYGVTAIALNGRFAEPPLFDYWGPSAAWFRAARARFDRHPDAFARAFDTGDFVVYRVRGASLDTLAEAPWPRPFVTPYVPGRDGISRREPGGLPTFLALALSPRDAAPGDTLAGAITWRALAREPVGSYQVAVRFDRPMPGGFAPPRWIGKPLRKLVERVRHERYRFRADHLPVAGDYGVDLWTPDEVVRDSFRLVVPRDVADGDYRVEVRMLRQAHYANLRLGDYFFDEDAYAGVPAGTLRVTRRRPRRAVVCSPPPHSHTLRFGRGPGGRTASRRRLRSVS